MIEEKRRTDIVKNLLKSQDPVKTLEEETYEVRRYNEERTSLLTGEIQYNKYNDEDEEMVDES